MTLIAEQLAATYRGLSYYSDVTTSVLSAESFDGRVYRNENRYRFVYDVDRGARVDGYLGQLFLIREWQSVTNWFRHAARYSTTPLDPESDWRDQFIPIGGMIDSEHPVAAMLLDRRTARTDGEPTTLRRVDAVVDVAAELGGATEPATLIEGGFTFSAQGINFDRSDETPVPGRLWLDDAGHVRKAEYDITAVYSATFGGVRNATLTVSYDEVRTAAPVRIDSDTFTFSPRAADVERAPARLFSAPLLSPDDDGSPTYLVGRAAPLFAGKTPQGDALALAEHRGERVVLFFWATWCPNSARAIGQIEQLAKAGIENVRVVGVNVDSDVGAAVVGAYQDRYGLSFPSVLDPGNKTTSAYRAVVIPTAVVVDSEGIIRYVGLGETEDLAQRYTDILNRIE